MIKETHIRVMHKFFESLENECIFNKEYRQGVLDSLEWILHETGRLDSIKNMFSHRCGELKRLSEMPRKGVVICPKCKKFEKDIDHINDFFRMVDCPNCGSYHLELKVYPKR